MQAINAKVTRQADNVACVACFCACCLCCLGAGWNRTQIRNEDKVEGSYIVDCLLHCLCGVCAVTQEWQHVMKKKRGSSKKTICDYNAGYKK
jgi:Cys-rich protein (TIGR01571 family)